MVQRFGTPVLQVGVSSPQMQDLADMGTYLGVLVFTQNQLVRSRAPSSGMPRTLFEGLKVSIHISTGLLLMGL